MSELINKNDNRAAIRWKLMASVSAAALIASACGDALAADSDTSRPLIWIELGAQLERANGGDSPFTPDFYSRIDPLLTSPAKIASELPWAFGPEAKISFQPIDSDWILSGAIHYGRSSNHRSPQFKTNPGTFYNVHKYQTAPGTGFSVRKCCAVYTKGAIKANFVDVHSYHEEAHLVLDFAAGKDVGLGIFGKESSSVVNVGVRFAQFRTRSEVSVKANTDVQHYNFFTAPPYQYASVVAFVHSLYPQKYGAGSRFRTYSLDAGSERSFKGIGPSLSWNASAALAGNSNSSELTFDWGVNAALLFGKQKTKTHHQSSGRYCPSNYLSLHYVSLYNHAPKHYTRSRNVTVPNVGGMAGFSIKWPNAKLSIGYRADVFFGAMDGGWDTGKKQNRTFMGPFASISVGLGD